MEQSTTSGEALLTDGRRPVFSFYVWRPFPAYPSSLPHTTSKYVSPPRVFRSVGRAFTLPSDKISTTQRPSTDVSDRHVPSSPERDVLRLAKDLAGFDHRQRDLNSAVSSRSSGLSQLSGHVHSASSSNNARMISMLQNQVVMLSEKVNATENNPQRIHSASAGGGSSSAAQPMRSGDNGSNLPVGAHLASASGNSVPPAHPLSSDDNVSNPIGSRTAVTVEDNGSGLPLQQGVPNIDVSAHVESSFYEDIPILNDYNKPKEESKPVPEYWAKFTATAFNRSIPKEEKGKFDKEYLPPTNVPYATAPSIPSYVWSRLPTYDRMADSRLQQTQKAASAPIIPLLRAVESVSVTGEVDKKQVIAHLSAAIAMIGETSNKVSMLRKNAIRSLVNSDYKSLCTKDVVVTSSLLGDDFDSKVKKIRETSKSQSLMKYSQSSSSTAKPSVSRPVSDNRKKDTFVRPQQSSSSGSFSRKSNDERRSGNQYRGQKFNNSYRGSRFSRSRKW